MVSGGIQWSPPVSTKVHKSTVYYAGGSTGVDDMATKYSFGSSSDFTKFEQIYKVRVYRT
jgi:hypothetical protein